MGPNQQGPEEDSHLRAVTVPIITLFWIDVRRGTPVRPFTSTIQPGLTLRRI